MTLSTALEIVPLAAAAFYCIVVLCLGIGIGRLRYSPQALKPFVSVIVAARNEEGRIEVLLRHLLAQDYPSFEIIIVNDRSNDQTGDIISQFQANQPSVRRIDIVAPSPDMPSKKNALTYGIAASSGEILCFTDADCAPPPQWISSLVAAFDQSVGLVAGYSPYAEETQAQPYSAGQRILQSFIRFEEFKGATWAAGSIGIHRGWLCTGRSLAYRRVVFDEVGGFERIKHSVSGDDDLFLQLVRRTTRWQVRFVTAPESFVPTYPPRSFREFVRQRIRHFSAGKYFPVSLQAFFVSFHASNLLILVAFVEALITGRSWHAYVPFTLKSLADAALFIRAGVVFQAIGFGASFLAHEILYVLYNSFIGPLGIVAKFQWKPENQN